MEKELEARFNEIYNLYAQNLFNIAYSYLKNKELASDIIQDVFLTYLLKKTNLDIECLKYYLIRITINKSINELKANSNKVLELKEEFYNNYSCENNISNLDLQKALDNLDNNSKSVIILFYFEDYSIEEIAKTLKISLSATKMRLSRAKEKLKEMLGDKYNEEGI